MEHSVSTKRHVIICIFVILVSIFLYAAHLPASDTYTHRVEKGDTLWSICEYYYGDPNLWPKLWEMNPFVTNPHFLKPGDMITLLEDEPLAVPVVAQEPREETKEGGTGIDVSRLTRIGAIGYLSQSEVSFCGRIASAFGDKRMLGAGDRAAVLLQGETPARIGDRFAVCRPSSLLRHPLTGKALGYTINTHGIIEITEILKTDAYEVSIKEAFRAVNVGDAVMAFDPVSTCIQPVSAESHLEATVVATKDQLKILGENSIVYLDQGSNDGIDQGNLFEVFQVTTMSDTDCADGRNILDEMKTASSLDELFGKTEDETPLFDRTLGTVLILEARPDTATGIVLSMKEFFANGASLRALSWDGPKDLIPRCPRCECP